MTIIFALIAFLSLLTVVISLILATIRFRPQAKKVATMSGAAFLLSFIVFVVLVDREIDDEARQLGFADATDRRKANEAGVPDPTAWQERKRVAEEGRVREQKAREEAIAKERQAQEEQQRQQVTRRQELLKPPVEQDRFVRAIEKARAAYKAGQTDLQRGAARPIRAKDICAALPSSELRKWIGKIVRLTTNGSGDGVLRIEISKGIELITMNNSLGDSPYLTMIKSDFPLYKKLLEMKEGDFVRFDADLFPASDDCYKEISLTMRGSLEEPNFVARFSDVTRIDLPSQ